MLARYLTRVASLSFGHKTSKVRKVQCGHFFHITCLEEVLKRAGGTHKANCPICRQKMGGKEGEVIGEGAPGAGGAINPLNQLDQYPGNTHTVLAAAVGSSAAAALLGREAPAAPAPPPQQQDASQQLLEQRQQRPLFRFSTESFPAWFPQFSFEVVQRPNAPRASAAAGAGRGGGLQDQVNFVSDMFPQVGARAPRARGTPAP